MQVLKVFIFSIEQTNQKYFSPLTADDREIDVTVYFTYGNVCTKRCFFLPCSRHNVSEHCVQRPPAVRQVGQNYRCTAIKA